MSSGLPRAVDPETLLPTDYSIVNKYTVGRRNLACTDALKSGKVLQVSDGTFLVEQYRLVLEKTDLFDWLEQHSSKVNLEEQFVQYADRHWVLRISFKDRRDTLMFKMSNETTRV